MGINAHFVFAVSVFLLGSAAHSDPAIPDWLNQHIGDSADHVARVILTRARAHYFEKKKSGQTKGNCYVAMDATRRHQIADDIANNRAFLICEDRQVFIPFSFDHGGGLNLPGLDLVNEKTCAKNFGNAINSRVTMGGKYLTGQLNITFKGQLKNANAGYSPFFRPFLVVSGEGETSNATDRDIGVHPAILLTNGCYKHEPKNPNADLEGDIYYAEQKVTYYDGRTEGCMGVREEVAKTLMSTAGADPLPIYVYPESSDIRNVAEAVAQGRSLKRAGLYWNKECLSLIKSPKYWDAKTYNKPIQDALDKIPPTSKVRCPKIELTEEIF